MNLWAIGHRLLLGVILWEMGNSLRQNTCLACRWSHLQSLAYPTYHLLYGEFAGHHSIIYSSELVGLLVRIGLGLMDLLAKPNQLYSVDAAVPTGCALNPVVRRGGIHIGLLKVRKHLFLYPMLHRGCISSGKLDRIGP